jgi:hypothetical protein
MFPAFFGKFSFVVHIVDYFFDLLLGYSILFGTRMERTHASEYETSAQLVTIMTRGMWTVFTAQARLPKRPTTNHHFRPLGLVFLIRARSAS